MIAAAAHKKKTINKWSTERSSSKLNTRETTHKLSRRKKSIFSLIYVLRSFLLPFVMLLLRLSLTNSNELFLLWLMTQCKNEINNNNTFCWIHFVDIHFSPLYWNAKIHIGFNLNVLNLKNDHWLLVEWINKIKLLLSISCYKVQQIDRIENRCKYKIHSFMWMKIVDV